VALYNAAGQQIASAPLFGTGSTPEMEFFPTGYGAALSTGSVATTEPMQIALDGMNNLYVANYMDNSVIEVPPQGGTALILASQAGGAYTFPEQAAGIAIDGSGNVFVSDHQASTIWVTNPSATYLGFKALQIDMDPNITPSTISEPMEINFDPAGNLYIADWGNGRVVEVSGIYVNSDFSFHGRGTVVMTNGTYLGGGYNLPAGTSTNVKSVTGVAVDPFENVYISDSAANMIITVPQNLNQIVPGWVNSTNLHWPYQNNSLPGVSGSFNLPQGLTFDGMGNIYIADAGNKRIIAGNFISSEFSNPTRNTGWGVTVTSNTSSPGPLGNNLFGVTVDPWGNVFVPDYANNRIAAYYPTTPPTENFTSEQVGLTSGTNTVSVFNIGNELLNFPGIAGGNPSISNNFVYGTGTLLQSTSGHLYFNPDILLTMIPSFDPRSVGNITGSIIATDNNLYPAGWTNTTTVNTTQTVPLAGTGLLIPTVSVVLTGTPNPAYILNPVTYTATVTGTTGGGNPTGTVTFYDGLTVLCTSTLTSGAGVTSVATCTADPQAVIATTQYVNGTHSITAVYSGSALYSTLTSNTLGEVVQDFSFAVPNPSSAIVNPGGTAIFTFTVSPVNGATFPAAIAFTVTGAPANSTVTLTPGTSIASGGSPTNIVMTVVAPMILTTQNHQPENLGRKLAPISFALLLLPLLGLRRMRRTWQRYIALLIMLVGGFATTTALSGCSTTPSGYFGQGTTYDYNITLTGTAGGLTHSAVVTLTVN
jgi:streptogramin lyase